ncbi:MAG: DUF3788 family protein [Bacteroidetes bacterium]|nr:DUF3788 family protein [Bacteroidota bacterium]
MKSVFTDKTKTPATADLKKALGKTYVVWIKIETFTRAIAPKAIAAWHFSGEKFGWSYRISDTKRVLVYLLPREHYFKVALVFGNKAVLQIQQSDISEQIIKELLAAKPYAEGRGIRIDVRDNENIRDIQKLIEIKIAN